MFDEKEFEKKYKELILKEKEREYKLLDLSIGGALMLIEAAKENDIEIEIFLESLKKWIYRLKNEIKSEVA